MDQKDPHEEAKSAKAGGAKLKGLKVFGPMVASCRLQLNAKSLLTWGKNRFGSLIGWCNRLAFSRLLFVCGMQYN